MSPGSSSVSQVAVRGLLAAVVAAGCVVTAHPRETGLDEFLGGGGFRPDPSYVPAGTGRPPARVVTEPPAGCTLLGYVSGVMQTQGERPLDATRASLEGTVDPTPAIASAQRVAAAHDADTIVVDGHTFVEHHAEVDHHTFYLVQGRAYQCLAPPPRPAATAPGEP